MYIIGSDEVGYGAWAGPLYVCAYMAPEGWTVPGLNDSKKLSRAQREEVYARLDLSNAVVLAVTAANIDVFGLYRALVSAHTQAIQQLLARGPDKVRVIVDGNMHLPKVPLAESIPRADGQFPAVMAASIIAKCNRDLTMREAHRDYPAYGFANHVGYGTAEHRSALAEHGPCVLHRHSFRPIRDLQNGEVP